MIRYPLHGAVTDMALIELDRLLNCTVDELTALVKPMSANSCEQYARAILGRIGGPSFEQVMMRIIQTAAPKDGAYPSAIPSFFEIKESGEVCTLSEKNLIVIF
jgi:hypothetical protein